MWDFLRRAGSGERYEAKDYGGWMHDCPKKGHPVWWPGVHYCMWCHRFPEVRDEP